MPQTIRVGYLKYLTELFFVFILVCYALQFHLGAEYNATLALAWTGSNMECFKGQFAAVGISNADSKKKESELLQQRKYNVFKYFATGRANCKYCLVTLNLKRRQDLVTMAILNRFWPELDRVIYDIPLAASELFPCIFILQRRDAVRPKDKPMARLQAVSGLSSQFAVFSEYREIVDHILSPEVAFVFV